MQCIVTICFEQIAVNLCCMRHAESICSMPLCVVQHAFIVMTCSPSLCLASHNRVVWICVTMHGAQHATKAPDVSFLSYKNEQKRNAVGVLGNSGWSTPQRSQSLGRGSPWGAPSRGPPSVASSMASIAERPQRRPPPIKREYSGAPLASH